MLVGCKEIASTKPITLLGLRPFRIRTTWQEPAHKRGATAAQNKRRQWKNPEGRGILTTLSSLAQSEATQTSAKP
jgi:hypothetical protein